MNTTLLSNTGKTIPMNFFPPYNLANKSDNSNQFYYQLGTISQRVVEVGMSHFKADIINFREKGYATNKQVQKSDNELLLEILMIGTFWNAYEGKWRWNIQMIEPIFKSLYKLRSTFMKSGADNLRGKLGALLLNRPNRDNQPFDIDNFCNLTRWLSSTGDFKMEVKMMNRWIDFLYLDIKRNCNEFLAEAAAYAVWFESYSKKQLENYTENARAFVQHNKKSYRGREDQFFTARTEVEYHLNMVGAEIMNESLRNEFLQTQHKILLLPTCMAKGNNCKATVKNGAMVCQHCTPGCNVSKTASEMKEVGIDTVLIKHSSDFSKWLKPWANQKQTGLIGTACVLNLLGGGYEMKELGIPSQCVFLDYSGCKKHWDKTGVPTQINVDRAKELVANVKIVRPAPEAKKQAV